MSHARLSDEAKGDASHFWGLRPGLDWLAVRFSA